MTFIPSYKCLNRNDNISINNNNKPTSTCVHIFQVASKMISNSQVHNNVIDVDQDQLRQSTNDWRKGSRRSRVGLMPTDGEDVYKRSSSRASRRSRPERASYMMANGHLDLDEIQQLTGNTNNNNNNQRHLNVTDHDRSSQRQNSLDSAASLTTLTTRPDVSGPHGLLNIAVPNHYADFQDNIFAHNNNTKSQTNRYNKNLDRGRFKQTYTEVTLPMKTSPAFEYIIKDNGRRNRRCCLWTVYTTLMTICVAIILYCTVQLLAQYHII